MISPWKADFQRQTKLSPGQRLSFELISMLANIQISFSKWLNMSLLFMEDGMFFKWDADNYLDFNE